MTTTISAQGSIRKIEAELKAIPGAKYFWVQENAGLLGKYYQSAKQAAKRARLEISDGWPCIVKVIA